MSGSALVWDRSPAGVSHDRGRPRDLPHRARRSHAPGGRPAEPLPPLRKLVPRLLRKLREEELPEQAEWLLLLGQALASGSVAQAMAKPPSPSISGLER